MPKRLKVRRSKGLYKKKKGGVRKALEAAVLLVVLAGLGFVGFTVADVLLHYEPRLDEDDIPADKPAVTTGNGTAEGTQPSSTDKNKDDEPSAPDVISGNVVYAPSDILVSSAALSSYLETAKSGGYDAIVVEMKDEDGRLLYQSKIKKVTEANGVSVGTLTAEQIANAAIAAGLKPIARISTLKDRIGSEQIENVSYKGWIDNAPGVGKRWADPFSAATVSYISDITAELYKAGFADIIFTNTIFPLPAFRGQDFDILPSYVTDPSIRFTGLGDFVNKVSAKNPDANIFLEMSLDCFGGNVGDAPIGTAEILRCLAPQNGGGGDGSLNISGIVLTFSRSDFGNGAGDSDSPDKAVKDGLSVIKPFIGNFKVTPLLDRDGLQEDDCDQIIGAFGSNGMKNFIIRN